MTTQFKGSDGGTWLRPGSIYAVQSIYISHDQSLQYRILGNEPNTPALFSASDFEIIDPTLPPSWRIFDLGNGNFVIGPSAWTAKGYWERYFDGDEEARQEFETYCTRIDQS
ncbi:MAG: hypothetical protein CJBNEKGG_03313 [Prosthecobacter sp.]|nr:hypothetical protein [Prosthecobacter sp.]